MHSFVNVCTLVASELYGDGRSITTVKYSVYGSNDYSGIKGKLFATYEETMILIIYYLVNLVNMFV